MAEQIVKIISIPGPQGPRGSGGLRGPAGPQGGPGPAGPPGAGMRTHEHEQSVASEEWIVNHNLGCQPCSVRLLTSGGAEFDAEIVQISDNQLRVYLACAATGRVICGG